MSVENIQKLMVAAYEENRQQQFNANSLRLIDSGLNETLKLCKTESCLFLDERTSRASVKVEITLDIDKVERFNHLTKSIKHFKEELKELGGSDDED